MNTLALDSLAARRAYTPAQLSIVGALYREHHARLVAYATRKLRSEDAAEDVVHDAFLAILGGDAELPAVDVARKLDAIVRARCEERGNQMARERAMRRMRKEARRAYAKTLRSLRGPFPDDVGDEEGWR